MPLVVRIHVQKCEGCGHEGCGMCMCTCVWNPLDWLLRQKKSKGNVTFFNSGHSNLLEPRVVYPGFPSITWLLLNTDIHLQCFLLVSPIPPPITVFPPPTQVPASHQPFSWLLHTRGSMRSYSSWLRMGCQGHGRQGAEWKWNESEGWGRMQLRKTEDGR